MSYILGIDTSSEELGIGLLDGTRVIGGISFYVRNSHADQIGAAVNYLLQAHSVSPSEITACGIAAGPGSFTGLRIGMAFLKGFLLGRNVPVLPVSSLESVAIAWEPVYNSVVVAFDARRDQVFWARFQQGQSGLTRVTSDAICSAQELPSMLNEDEPVITDTVGNRRCTSFQTLSARDHVYSVSDHPLQRGVACARKASRTSSDAKQWLPALDLSPRYLSPSYVDRRAAAPQRG